MFNPEATYTAMECRSSSPKDGAVSGTYLLKDDEVEEDSEDSDSLKEEPTQTPSPGKSRKCILAISLASVFVVGVAIAILVLVVTALTTSLRGASSPVAQGQSVFPTPLSTTVTPTCGGLSNAVVCLIDVGSRCHLMLIGNKEEDIFVFKGVPYALPPISQRRWKQPVPYSASCSDDAEPFEYIYTQSFGNACMQLGRDGVRPEGSEDCLFLNVWTPTLASDADLHVMVYFHGGGLIAGSGNGNGSLPTPQLVTDANMVFVTFNYRLNAFGFLALEALATGGAAGNYGLMDQILALQWVQTNIRSFGGSPDKVTVFGQGSGATSIYALLASERVAGLFQKAWLASPSPKLENGLAEAYKQNAEFLNNTECADSGLVVEDRLECLLNLSAEKVLQAVPWKLWRNLHFYRLPLKTEQSAIIALVDGFVLKSSPLDAWKKRTFSAVPLLIGNTAQETDVYPMNEKLVAWSIYDNYVYQLMLPFDHVSASDVLSMYGHSLTPEYSLATMVSDMRVICPVDEMVKVAANASRLPVYRYIASIFSDKRFSASGVQKNYAYSGIDVDAFFGADSESSTHQDERFTALMRDIVFGFVRNGSVRDWDAFPHSAYNVSTDVERIVPRFMSSECNFWRTNWFFPSYAWMN